MPLDMHPGALEPWRPFERPLLRTPFHDRARALAETDRFIGWAGYSTVEVFTRVEQEYFAIRNAASVFDLSPMVKYRISGPDAEAYLNRLVTRNVGKLGIDRVSYVVWCDDAGHIISDGTLFRLGPQEFRLCAGEHQLDWLLASAVGFDVALAEVTHEIAALSLQGPTSCGILKALGLVGIERLKPFQIGHFAVDGIGLMVSRTGFTGDLGYELWLAPEAALRFWDRLMAAGHTRGIRAIGWAALDMARIEAGFIQANIDFVSALTTVHLDRARSPLELGLGWLVDFGCGHFTGRRALLAEQKRGGRRQLVGLDIDGDKPATGALLYRDRDGAKPIGAVTSALWSPTAKRNIALAMIEAPYFAGEQPIWAEIYLQRELVWERRMRRARITARPFFAPDRRKLTPPADR